MNLKLKYKYFKNLNETLTKNDLKNTFLNYIENKEDFINIEEILNNHYDNVKQYIIDIRNILKNNIKGFYLEETESEAWNYNTNQMTEARIYEIYFNIEIKNIIYKIENIKYDLENQDFEIFYELRETIQYKSLEKFLKSLKNLHFMFDYKNGRIHFDKGIPDVFKGIGFGYMLYKKALLYDTYLYFNNDMSIDARRMFYKLSLELDTVSILLKGKTYDSGYIFLKNLLQDNTKNNTISNIFYNYLFNRKVIEKIKNNIEIFNKYYLNPNEKFIKTFKVDYIIKMSNELLIFLLKKYNIKDKNNEYILKYLKCYKIYNNIILK